MDTLIASVKKAFGQAGWSFTSPGRDDVVECQFDAHHCRVALHVQCHEEMSALSVVASPSVAVDDGRLPKAAELLMRANLQLSVGNLELDWDNGKVFFRASNIFPDPTGLGQVPQSLVHTAIAEADRIAPLITLINRDPNPGASGVDAAKLLAREDLIPPVPEGVLE